MLDILELGIDGRLCNKLILIYMKTYITRHLEHIQLKTKVFRQTKYRPKMSNVDVEKNIILIFNIMII